MKRASLLLLAFWVALGVAADTPPDQTQGWRILQRYDLTRRINNGYQGIFYGHVLGIWTPDADSGRIQTHYLVAQESRRDNSQLEKPLDQDWKGSFQFDAHGRMAQFQGDKVPLFRNFPEALPEDYQKKPVWVGTGEWVTDPLNTGKPTRVPLLVEYRFKGMGVYNGNPVVQVFAKYALRYHQGQDVEGDPGLKEVRGTHESDISYDPSTRQPVFIKTKALEQFINGENKTIQNEGFYLTFYQGTAPYSRQEETHKIEESIKQDQLPDVKVTRDDQGVKLTLENLRFVANSPELLPGEESRLDKIAALLKTVPNRSFLVAGHTADFGSREAQMDLSRQRALSIVKALTARGIEAKRLYYEGRGSTQPVAPNDTEEHMAKNRRVEILILED